MFYAWILINIFIMKINMQLYSHSKEKCVYILTLQLNDLRLNEGICNTQLFHDKQCVWKNKKNSEGSRHEMQNSRKRSIHR